MHRMRSEGVECIVGVGGLNVSVYMMGRGEYALEIGWKLKKKRKNNARTWYRHNCESVIQMLNTTGHVVA